MKTDLPKSQSRGKESLLNTDIPERLSEALAQFVFNEGLKIKDVVARSLYAYMRMSEIERRIYDRELRRWLRSTDASIVEHVPKKFLAQLYRAFQALDPGPPPPEED